MQPEAEPHDHLMATCVHEAAHAVIAHSLGFEESAISFLPDGSGEMRTDPRGSIWADTASERAEREVEIALAGSIAEYRFFELQDRKPGPRTRSSLGKDGRRTEGVAGGP
jgi:hypothetical protein